MSTENFQDYAMSRAWQRSAVDELVAGEGVVVVEFFDRGCSRRVGWSNLGGVRQWIESVNQTLKGQLGLEHHGGRTLAGVFIRVAQRLLAMAAAIWHNWTRRDQQTITDRLRPLPPTSRNSII